MIETSRFYIKISENGCWYKFKKTTSDRWHFAGMNFLYEQLHEMSDYLKKLTNNNPFPDLPVFTNTEGERNV